MRHPERHGAGLGRGRQYPHCFGQGRHDLLWPLDAVPIARHVTETIIHRHILCLRRLDLLQHRGYIAPGEDVARQEQDRQSVDCCGGRAGDHVGGARPDRSGAGQSTQAVGNLGVASGSMHHCLLIAAQEIRKRLVLVQGLAQAGHVAVAEDAEATAEEAMPLAIALHELLLEKLDRGLGHRQASRH